MNSPFTRQLLRYGVAVLALLVGISLPSACKADNYPSLGASSILFYNSAREPVRRVGNVPYMTSCASTGPSSLAVGYLDTQFLTIVDDKGVSRQTKLPGNPVDIFGDKDGYLITIHHGPVVGVAPTGEITQVTRHIAFTKAVRHPQGGFVGINLSGQLFHVRWDSEINARATNETLGRSVSFVDVAAQDPSTFVALDSTTNELVVFDLALREVKRSPAPIQKASELSALSNSLLLVSQDKMGVTLLAADGSSTNLKAQLKVMCAGGTEDGGFYLGLTGNDTAYIPTDYHADFETARAKLTYDSLFAIIVYTLVGSVLFVWIWRAISRKALSRLGKTQTGDSRATPSDRAEGELNHREVRWIGILALLIAVAGLYLSWRVGEQVRLTGSEQAWGLYILGACVAAGALLYLGRRAAHTSLLPTLHGTDPKSVKNSVSWFLLALAVASVAISFHLNEEWKYPRTIVITWIAAQVFALGAFPSSLPSPRWPKGQVFQVLLLCALTAFSRAYKWTECPHDTHFDFGIIAEEAVRNLADSWNSLFALCAGQTIGRVWLLQMSASIWAFGLDEWVIRLSALVWSVGYVLASYLLGRELISHRFGMIAGLLGALQHTLLGYSRLPYVIESTGPFVFCLYFLCRGLRTSSFHDWAVAGLWAGWSVMTVRTCTTFPFVGAAIFAYMCVVHPRAMWRRKAHILVMVATATIAFAPFYNFYMHGQSLTHRLEGMSPLFSKDGIKTDPAIWIAQFSAGFGAVLRYVDRLSWPMENAAPICLAITGSLFGCGLILLLVRFRSLATPIILLSIAANITLGSAVLENPPSYYHHFVGTLFVMFVVAVPIEYLFEIASRIRWRFVGGIMTVLVCALTVVATNEVVTPFVSFCKPAMNPDGTVKSRSSFYTVLSGHILRNRDHRFVSVSNGENYFDFHHAHLSIFYGQFSERYDIRSPVSSQLPLRPNEKSQPVEFIVLPGHEAQLEAVKRFYPVGELTYLPYAWGNVISYKVSGEEIRRVHAASLAQPSNFDRSFYELTPA